MSAPTIVKNTAAKKAEMPVEAVAAPKPKPDLSLHLNLCCPGQPDLKLRWIPLPCDRGIKVELHRDDGSGCDRYINVFNNTDELGADLRMCLRLYVPTTAALTYKGFHTLWKFQTILSMLAVQDGLMRSINKHDCAEHDCDPDEHDTQDHEFRAFIEERIMCMLTNSIMEVDCHYLYKRAQLEGKECPIMMEPLVVGETIKLGACGHYLSREGWFGCKGNCCPLCRANQAHSSPAYL
jgi:hypothetical protein